MITVSTADSAGTTLIKKLIGATGAITTKYSRGPLTWCMNEATYAAIMTELVAVTATGSVVSGMTNTMPVVGGEIVLLPFMANNQIVVGHFDLYLLAERAGQQFASSEHVRFLSDQTVFKGTARYDGMPVIAEGFVFIGIDSTTPVVSGVTFAQDVANDAPVPAIALNAAAATVTSGSTIQLFAMITPGMGTVEWVSATTAKATVDSTGVVTGVASGSSVITATCDGLSASCTVTVTNS